MIDYSGQFDGYCCILFAALLLKEVPVVAGRKYNVLILPPLWRHNVQLKTEFNLRTVIVLHLVPGGEGDSAYERGGDARRKF